eukprot:9154779-Prorocentrum_lima.AAC.1
MLQQVRGHCPFGFGDRPVVSWRPGETKVTVVRSLEGGARDLEGTSPSALPRDNSVLVEKYGFLA